MQIDANGCKWMQMDARDARDASHDIFEGGAVSF